MHTKQTILAETSAKSELCMTELIIVATEKLLTFYCTYSLSSHEQRQGLAQFLKFPPNSFFCLVNHHGPPLPLGMPPA